MYHLKNEKRKEQHFFRSLSWHDIFKLHIEELDFGFEDNKAEQSHVKYTYN